MARDLRCCPALPGLAAARSAVWMSRWTAGATGRLRVLTVQASINRMHRFYFDFDWDGSELLLQSRASTPNGYVQPTKDALRAVRGENSIYHNNGIQTWHVKKDGTVENVEVS